MIEKKRNLDDYKKQYMSIPFEAYQVKYRRKNIIDQMSYRSHERVLEIGCGMEPLFQYVKDVKKWVVVEPTDWFYENAKKMAPDNVVLIRGGIEDVISQIRNVIDGFDYILCNCLLHEFQQPEILLSSIKELCSEHTIVNISVPNAKSVHRILGKEMGVIEDIYCKSDMSRRMQQGDRVYDLDSLKFLCKKNGYEVINEGSYFVKPFTHGQMQQCLDSGIFDNSLLDGLDALVRYMPEFGSEIYVELKKLYK